VDKLKALSQVAKGLVEQGSKEVTRTDLDRIQVYLLLAETRGVEANVGLARALAALREAMGVPPGCPVALADSDLGIYMVTLQNYATANKLALSVEQAVKHAWAHRPDLRQAQLFADMAGLEAEAQRQTHQPYVRTFAATGDIHAPILPAGEINGNYRPGPLGPDMPVYLAGSKDVRVARAQTLFRRALAVVDKAKGLIALQVTEAAERVQQEVQQVDSLRQAVAKSSKLAEESEKFFRADNLSVEKMLNAQLLELQVKAQLNEALFRHATAVATLQNAIAGQVYEAYAPVAPAK
jgi:outer membrane protein TolC